MSATEPDLVDRSGVRVDPQVVEDIKAPSTGAVHKASEAVKGRFSAAWGVVRHSPRSVKRGILFAKDHPGMVWNQTRGVVLIAGTATFLFLMFSFIYATSPVLAMLVALMSLGLLVITGQSAVDQLKFTQLLSAKLTPSA